MHLNILKNAGGIQGLVVGAFALFMAFYMEKSVPKKHPEFPKEKLARNVHLVKLWGIILLIVGIAELVFVK